MTEIIVVDNMTKCFNDVQALSGISFQVKQGELFGFLGPNGAGKTTTINLLTGLARPDAGSMQISGIDCSKLPRQAQHLIGVVPDESNLYPELSGFDNLCFCAALYGMAKQERQARARELLEMFGLSQAADRRFGCYSKGMKRKLTIAAGIIHRPRILFLDEPTTGIDVASARQLRQLVADLHWSGTTIFLTTHYIEEAERLCDRIAFIVAVRIVRIDAVRDLLQPLQDKHVFGSTSLLAVTVTFEKKQRSFERLLLAPIPLEPLMLAKTSGAILFGTVNAFVPVIMAAFLMDLSQVDWWAFVPAVIMIAVASTFLGIFIAVAVSEVFEAQTFSNFFRFPMIFLCGLFFPIEHLPVFLKPISFALPLTYGADVLHGAVHGAHMLPFVFDLAILALFCIGLFVLSLRNIKRYWIA